MNRDFLTDKKYTVTFFLLAACLLLTDIYLWGAIAEKRERIHALKAEAVLLENWSTQPKENNHISFLENILREMTVETISAAFLESGCTVEEIGEEENSKFHIFHIKGNGSFSQITAAFGIIKSKERWSAAELRSLKREGGVLAYEAEVRAVRN